MMGAKFYIFVGPLLATLFLVAEVVTVALLQGSEKTAAIPTSAADIARQVPALAVLVVVVIMFLRSLERVTDAHRKELDRISVLHASQMKSLLQDYERTMTQTTSLYARILEKLGAIGK